MSLILHYNIQFVFSIDVLTHKKAGNSMDEGTSGKEEIKGSIAQLKNLKSMIGEKQKFCLIVKMNMYVEGNLHN